MQVALRILHLAEHVHIESFTEIEPDNDLQHPVAIYKSRNWFYTCVVSMFGFFLPQYSSFTLKVTVKCIEFFAVCRSC